MLQILNVKLPLGSCETSVEGLRRAFIAQTRLQHLLTSPYGWFCARDMVQDSGELAAAISSVSAPSNPTLGKVPGLSEKGFVCPETGNFVDELEINDYPQVARYKLTQKVSLHWADIPCFTASLLENCRSGDHSALDTRAYDTKRQLVASLEELLP